MEDSILIRLTILVGWGGLEPPLETRLPGYSQVPFHSATNP